MISIQEFWYSYDYENLQLLRQMVKHNPLNNNELDALGVEHWSKNDTVGLRQLSALGFKHDDYKYSDEAIRERVRIILDYDFDFKAIGQYEDGLLFDVFNKGERNERIEIWKPIRHGRLGIARLYRNGRDDSQAFKKECARECWNNTVTHIKLEHGYTEHEATMFLRSKAQWKWEQLCKYTIQLVRNEYIPTSVFKELAAAPSNRAFEKVQNRWGLELNASHPRRTAWAQLIVDVRGGK